MASRIRKIVQAIPGLWPTMDQQQREEFAQQAEEIVSDETSPAALVRDVFKTVDLFFDLCEDDWKAWWLIAVVSNKFCPDEVRDKFKERARRDATALFERAALAVPGTKTLH